MRKIVKTIKSRSVIEGAGVHLRRAFGFGETELFDPFLLMDDFRSDEPDLYRKGFPWHPHRGIETITYMLKGSVEHGDSLGNSGIIAPGDVQWMTAGGGIIHQEMPRGDTAGSMHGFQLWANLPASRKMMKPSYRGITAAEIPEVRAEGGARIKVICGTVGKTRGPVTDVVIDPEYLDVSVPSNSSFTHPVRPGHTVLSYVIGGAGVFCGDGDAFSYNATGANYFDFANDRLIGNHTLIVYGDGDAVGVTTGDEGVRFLLVSGKPIRESVAWHGPIVMNTHEELRRAFEDLNNDTFLRYEGD
ncbi:MAG TPA: pirin family protein [Spirochaetota bacterium]|nr:pirin family protein [Spirochaetota bacterium]